MGVGKTNAMRILDQKKVDYTMHHYEYKDGEIDGVSVAAKIHREPENVYKTLVAQGNSGDLYVFVIGVDAELDLKKAAKAAGEKKVEMLPVKEIQKHTGYIRGGCSPLGMKKLYPTFIDAKAMDRETIVVSAGKIGLQVELNPSELAQVVNGTFVDLLK